MGGYLEISWKVTGQKFSPAHLSSQLDFYCQFNHSAIARGFLLLREATLDVHQRPVVTECLTKLLPKPDGSIEQPSVPLFVLLLFSKCCTVWPKLQHPGSLSLLLGFLGFFEGSSELWLPAFVTTQRKRAFG